nr:universal stress protein [Arthrobacter sp. Soil736]
MQEVLVGADGSAAGRKAEDWAAQRANDLGLRLNLVRVVPGPWAYRRPSQYRDAMTQAQALLEAESARVSALVPSVEIVVTRRTGETPSVLRLLSDGAETVVVGSDRPPDRHGEGFGSVSFQVAVLSRSPVAIIPGLGLGPRDSAGVVVGVDGSADSAIALDLAGVEALRMGEELTVVYVKPNVDAPSAGESSPGGREPGQDGQMLISAAGAVRDSNPGLVVNETLEMNDSPADALLRAAAHARLLVIGCRGRGGLRKPVGAIAEKILLHLPCPTIVTRPATQRAA